MAARLVVVLALALGAAVAAAVAVDGPLHAVAPRARVLGAADGAFAPGRALAVAAGCGVAGGLTPLSADEMRFASARPRSDFVPVNADIILIKSLVSTNANAAVEKGCVRMGMGRGRLVALLTLCFFRLCSSAWRIASEASLLWTQMANLGLNLNETVVQPISDNDARGAQLRGACLPRAPLTAPGARARSVRQRRVDSVGHPRQVPLRAELAAEGAVVSGPCAGNAQHGLYAVRCRVCCSILRASTSSSCGRFACVPRASRAMAWS